MSKSQRDKGARREREMVAKHVGIGVKAERVPLSGGAHYKGEGHDIDVYASGPGEAPLVCEVKARGNGEGFKTLTAWLGENDALFLIADRQEPIVALPWRVWANMISQPIQAADARGRGREKERASGPRPESSGTVVLNE